MTVSLEELGKMWNFHEVINSAYIVMVKPGCELNTFLESANSVLGSLTQRDIILICGGSNDFNTGKGESIIDHIMEFIKTNNHTNIVLTNVPVRYDLSYYSPENKGIRSFNKKLMEITKEHKQVALIEIDTESIIHDMAYILIS